MRTATRNLTAGIRITVHRVDGTENRGGAELQTAAFGRRGQDVGLLAHRLQLQTGTLQQPRKALLHGELAGQTGAVATAHQRRVHRQIDPGQTRETGQRCTKAACRHLITASRRVFGPTGGDKQRTGTEAQQQAQVH